MEPPGALTPIDVAPITLDDVPSFHACLDAVARERRFLALTEAPPLEATTAFVAANLRGGVPQLVARRGDQVVGWCDIVPHWQPAWSHCGSVGMGLLSAFRGQGLGSRLLAGCLALAGQRGLTRIELDVRVDNAAGIRLYERLGFRREGVKARGMRVDGRYVDTLAMALLLGDGS